MFSWPSNRRGNSRVKHSLAPSMARVPMMHSGDSKILWTVNSIPFSLERVNLPLDPFKATRQIRTAQVMLGTRHVQSLNFLYLFVVVIDTGLRLIFPRLEYTVSNPSREYPCSHHHDDCKGKGYHFSSLAPG